MISTTVIPSRKMSVHFARTLPVIVCVLALAISSLSGSVAFAQSTGRIVAIVNDEPISEYDLDQRVRFNETIRGVRMASDQLRRESMQELVDNTLKRQEANRFEMGVTQATVDENYNSMATRAGVSQEQWLRQLNDGGIEVTTIKLEVESSLSWRRVVTARYGQLIQVETEDVDRAYARVLDNPVAPTYIYEIQRILLPIESNASTQLRNTRLQEAHGIMQRINGCGSIGNATSGVFNVRTLGRQGIPSDALPAELKNALNQAGVGRPVGPGPTGDGVVIFVYCNLETIAAPVPTRDQVEEELRYDKFDRIGEQFLRDLRRDAIIEYRDPELAS